MRAPPVLHVAAGRPDPRRDTHPAEGACYWCAAHVTEACRVDDVLTDSFTDQGQALVRSSPWLCAGCTWAMTGRPPDTLRLWSIAWTETPHAWPAGHPSAPDLGPHAHAQNKADPSGFRALLRSPPPGRWLCSIADTGQIHTLPYATVNRGGGRYAVRYERTTVHATAAQYTALDDSIARLMAAGFTKQDIADQPFPSRLAQCGLDTWRREQVVLAPHRGSALLELALFLARKADDDGRREAAPGDRPGASHDGQRTEREDSPDRVVVAGQERAGDRGYVGGQLRLDGVDDGAQAPDRRDDDRDGRARRGGGARRRR